MANRCRQLHRVLPEDPSQEGLDHRSCRIWKLCPVVPVESRPPVASVTSVWYF